MHASRCRPIAGCCQHAELAEHRRATQSAEDNGNGPHNRSFFFGATPRRRQRPIAALRGLVHLVRGPTSPDLTVLETRAAPICGDSRHRGVHTRRRGAGSFGSGLPGILMKQRACARSTRISRPSGRQGARTLPAAGSSVRQCSLGATSALSTTLWSLKPDRARYLALYRHSSACAMAKSLLRERLQNSLVIPSLGVRKLADRRNGLLLPPRARHPSKRDTAQPSHWLN